MKIGLTGSIACGKSTVAAMIREAGWPVADADAVSRALTAPGGEALPALREAFGDAVFDGGALDRRALGRLVFADPRERARLDALLHPLIIARTLAEAADGEAAFGLSFADVPLLYECRMQDQFDRVWVVCAPRDVQIARLRARDGLDAAEAERRIDAQMPLAEKLLLADAAIDAGGSVARTRAQVERLLAELRVPRLQPAKERP